MTNLGDTILGIIIEVTICISVQAYEKWLLRSGINDHARRVAPIYVEPVDDEQRANKEIIELLPVIVKGIIISAVQSK